ncbi:MAG: 4Fe-4S dicluster domain-containing protein [Desulfatibacillum sp.]|nr:4Fe-4S dicluster domain-containing protein [Desulfatibacillum sp.]
MNSPSQNKPALKLSRHSRDFANKVNSLAHTDTRMCFQCQACYNTCPFVGAMDVTPPAILRLVLLGEDKLVLNSTTIWTCVGCHTCSTICPQNVDMGAVMDALRQIALERGIAPAQPEVLIFHNAILDSIKKYGRTHKLEIMLRYKMKNLDLFSDMDVGLKMLAKRKLDMLPSRVKKIEQVRRLFSYSNGKSNG